MSSARIASLSSSDSPVGLPCATASQLSHAPHGGRARAQSDVAEVLEHVLAAAPRVVRVVDHRAQLAALDLGAALQRLDVERRILPGLRARRGEALVVAREHAVALEDADRGADAAPSTARRAGAACSRASSSSSSRVSLPSSGRRAAASTAPRSSSADGIGRVDQELLQPDVAVVEQQHAARRLAVAAAAAGLLVVRLGAARDVGVDDQPDVALVDAHAERVGRDDHVELARHEHVLRLARARRPRGRRDRRARACRPS